MSVRSFILGLASVACLAMAVHVQADSRFNCKTYPAPPTPKNISFLNPAHVSLVASFGDSITAAFAARSSLLEARDISWSIGVGTAEQLTFPWLLSQYSPKVEGMSEKAVIPRDITHLPHNDYHPETDKLNVAESEGAVHRGSMEEQWEFFKTGLAQYGDLSNRWAVVTVWMTANDVCGKCDGPFDPSYIDDWTNRTSQLIANISTTLDNVYVNLISTLDLSSVARQQRAHEFCKIEHKYILQECGCIDRGNDTQLDQLDKNVHTMNARLHGVAKEWYNKLQQEKRDNMAVVVQSFQEGFSIESFDFLNKLDCFHPSTVGHEDLAIGLWNSMLCVDDRAKRCGQHFTMGIKPTCPDATSVFYTGPDVVPIVPPLA